MSEDKKKTAFKMNMYCIHRLLWDSKQLGQPDKEIWTDLKELFQSADYNLSMEIRPIEMVWGDTEKVDQILKDASDKFTEKTSRETDPSQ